MRWVSEFMRRVGVLFRGRKFDREMEEEMRLHLELREKEHAESGLSAAEAHMTTRKTFGNALALREASHDSWGWSWLEHLAQDLRFAFRMFRKNPGFTATVVLTLALGIGANTAIFSIIDAVFLRPLPYPNGSKVYLVERTNTRLGGVSISMAIYTAWKKEKGIFQDLVLLHWMDDATLTGSGQPERLPSVGVSTGFLAMTGMRPLLGRGFLPDEGRPGGRNVVMLSYGLWRNHFGSDPGVIGKSLVLDGEAFTVIGVLPRGFALMPLHGSDKAQLWFPIQVPVTSQDAVYGNKMCIGLLKPRVTTAQAEAALTPTLTALRQQFPNMFGPNEKAHLKPLREVLSQWAGTAPLLLFGAVGLVLLIACANIANLTLARSTARKQELAIRAALGGGRTRIARQLLTESVVLAMMGGLLGIAACYASFGMIVSVIPADLPHIGTFHIDGYVLVFAFLLSVLCGIVFGLLPALGASRVDFAVALKEATAQAGGRRSGRLRRALASSEVAFSLVLLIGAALALESFGRLMNVRPGFDPSNVLTFNVLLPEAKYATQQQRNAFFDQAIARVKAVPGVKDAALADVLPFEGGSDTLFNIVGNSTGQSSTRPLDADIRLASPDYFSALHIPLLRGRSLTESDNASSRLVVVINHAMAHAYWPNQNPIGQEIWIGKPMGPKWTEPGPRVIVGVAGDIRDQDLSQPPEPAMYIPYAQRPDAGEAYFLVRTRNAPLGTAGAVRDALKPLDADLPLGDIRPLDSVISSSLTGWRFRAILLGIFGALALVIAAVGVYGVISYSVAQRTHEMGVRMALGAKPSDVLRLVIGQGLKVAGIGVAVGVALALGLTRLIASLLYGVSASDPATFAGVAILLLIVAVAACYVPARRAAKVDPMTALRYE